MKTNVISKFELMEERTMERRIEKYGEEIAIVPIKSKPPMTRCSLCVRHHDFSLMRRNKSGEFVCNKCMRPGRATINVPTITETDNQSKRNTSRLENFFGKRIGDLKRR